MLGERDWAAFVTIVEEGNITKAAERLYLSQPALSYRIRHIESALGVSLFIRNSGGIILTPEGEMYAGYCRRMLREMREIKEQLANMSDEVQGTLTIASAGIFANYELPVLLRSFTDKYPKVHIQVKTGLSHRVSKLFNSGECMVAIIRGDYKNQGRSFQLYEEPYCLTYYRKVDWSELPDLSMIRYKTDPTVTLAVDTWWNENFTTRPPVTMELDTMSTCRRFIRQGLGWAVLPHLGLEALEKEGLYVEPLCDKNGKPMMRSTSLYYDEASIRLTAVKAFIDHVKHYYGSL